MIKSISSTSAPQLEKVLIHIWEASLNHRPIGVKDDFFDSGGNLNIAQHIITSIERELQTTIPLVTFIQERTIDKLVHFLQEQGSWKHLVTIQPKGVKYPFFCVAPSLSSGEFLGKIAVHLGEDQPLFGLVFAKLDGDSELDKSIQDMAKHNISEIRTLQPEGPYLLGGMCFGGLVAYEMAQQLLAQDQQVAFLGIMDSSFAPKQARTLETYAFLLVKFINDKFFPNKPPTLMPGQRERIMRRTSEDTLRTKRLQQLSSTHSNARMMYTSPPYPGEITLFSTERRIAPKLRVFWQKATTQRMEIIPIPGGHGGNRRGEINEDDQFISDQNVTILAQKLAHCLENVDLSFDKI
jgi:thioesterase domain-containing protein